MCHRKSKGLNPNRPARRRRRPFTRTTARCTANSELLLQNIVTLNPTVDDRTYSNVPPALTLILFPSVGDSPWPCCSCSRVFYALESCNRSHFDVCKRHAIIMSGPKLYLAPTALGQHEQSLLRGVLESLFVYSKFH